MIYPDTPKPSTTTLFPTSNLDTHSALRPDQKPEMSPPSWEMHPKLYAVAAFALAYYIVTTAYQWYRLRKVPGPFLAGFSSLWINWTFASGDASPYYDFAKKYGHLVRVGPNLLFTDDAEQLRKMCVSTHLLGRFLTPRLTDTLKVRSAQHVRQGRRVRGCYQAPVVQQHVHDDRCTRARQDQG